MFSSKDIFFTSVGGYRIEKSLRFRSSASAYLNRTPSVAGDTQTWTWSGWVKRGIIGSAQVIFATANAAGNNYVVLQFNANDTLYLSANDGVSTTDLDLITNAVFRDPSSWYHILINFNTTSATSTNRAAIYVNGVLQTYSTATYMTQSYSGRVNAVFQHNIGSILPAATSYFDGYMAEVNFIDGQALTPSSFGETDATTGVWKPKAYTGTYGTNGFYLRFNSVGSTTAGGANTGYGADSSGLTTPNNWTTNNFGTTSTATTYDSMRDTPMPYDDGGNGVGNYAVPNPLDVNSTTLSNGNLQVTSGATSAALVRASFSISSGKWYWEVTCGTQTGTAGMIGVTVASAPISAASWTTAFSWTYFGLGQKYNNNSGATYGASYTTGDVIGVALDADAGSITFYKNGASQGVAYNTGLSGLTLSPSFGNGTTGGSQIYNANFGQRPFAYTPPSGFKALNTQNLPTPTIAAGNKYFDATAYAGNSSTNNITNSGSFQPDFVWIKNRSGAQAHYLNDAVRGVYKTLFSNLTNAEYDGTSTSDGVSAFNSGGFTLLNGTNAVNYNASSNNYVAWQWKANGPVSPNNNTSGTITSTVSANTTAGFSVVTYTGTSGTNETVGHGLGVTPRLVIIKNRSSAVSWPVMSFLTTQSSGSALTSTTFNLSSKTGGVINLNLTAAAGAYTLDAQMNSPGSNYVAYCFAAVAGYSAFGSYTGNGSADGPFVFTGFRPRYVMVKRSDSTGNWFVWDSARDPYNTVIKEIYPDSSSAETTRTGSNDSLDFVSNGFKIRFSSTFADRNANGGTYIYAAFAENPFSKALAR